MVITSTLLRQVTIAGVSTQATEIMAVMQSNHITMSHEYISGQYMTHEGQPLKWALLFSFTFGYDETLINKLKNDSSIYDLFIIGD